MGQQEQEVCGSFAGGLGREARDMLKPEDIKLVVEYTEDIERSYTEACLEELDKILKNGTSLEDLLSRTRETTEKAG